MSVPVAWVVGMMVALEPTAPWRPTFQKTAEAIARVAESEPLYDKQSGPQAEERTAALLVAVAWFESRLKPNAKSGNGQWYCLYQIDKRRFPEPQKALEDPEVCTRTAVKMLRASFDRCSARPPKERLALFMSGACDKGLAESRYRTHLAEKLLREHPVPVDAGAVAARVP